MLTSRDLDFQKLTQQFQQFCNSVLSENYQIATMHIQEAKLNLDSPINASGESLLCIVAGEGKRDACLFLLSNGASLHGTSPMPSTHVPITNAFRNGHSDLAKELIQYAFQHADKKCDPQIALGTSILIAVNTADLSLLKYLIQQKANINAVNEKGHTALHMLAYHLTNEAPITSMQDPVQFTQTLLKAGIDVSLTCVEIVRERCPFQLDYPGDDALIIDVLYERTALQIADSKASIINYSLLNEFIKLIHNWPLQLERKQCIGDSLNFFSRQLITVVQEYAVPDNTIENKSTHSI